jgi:hypothetical protein
MKTISHGPDDHGRITSFAKSARTTGLAHAGACHGTRGTWLPDPLRDRSGAITAMMLAGPPVDSDMQSGHYLRQDINDCAELGLTGPDAAIRASAPPSDSASQQATDRDAGA